MDPRRATGRLWKDGFLVSDDVDEHDYSYFDGRKPAMRLPFLAGLIFLRHIGESGAKWTSASLIIKICKKKTRNSTLDVRIFILLVQLTAG